MTAARMSAKRISWNAHYLTALMMIITFTSVMRCNVKQPNESPSTTDQLTSATQYLLDRFSYQARMEQVHEWMDADKLTEALRKHEAGDLMAINLLMEETARMLCAKSAETLIKVHGDAWQEFYERDEFEW